MTDEYKNLEEQTETLIDALEAEDRMGAPENQETPDEVREEVPAEEIVQDEERDLREEISELRREVEQLRGGLRGVGHPEMIQTHVDNFLAKIAGEVPADESVRTSQEFWLNEIAKWTAGQSTDDASTKKIYWHTLLIERSGAGYGYYRGYMIILNNSSTPIDITAFTNMLKTPGFVGAIINGRTGGTSDISATDSIWLTLKYFTDANFAADVMNDSTHAITTNTPTINAFTVTDLGANAIN